VADVMYAPGQEPPPSCSPLAVHVTGLDDVTIPDWTERDGVWFTDSTVAVDGRWQDGAIAVGSVHEADPPIDSDDLSWDVPCDPPGGWTSADGLPAGTTPEEWEGFRIALADAMDAQPERFHGRWIGYPDGDPNQAPVNDMGEPQFDHTVMIVSTVDDPAAVQAALAAVYPGNLCVLQVQHSLAELEAVVDRLEAPDGSWLLDAMSLDASAYNRVQLDLPALDEAAVERIGTDADLLNIAPLVRPV
jgi:hypothetical protein